MNILLTGCFKYTEKQIEIIKSLGFSVFFMQQEKEELPIEASIIDATICNGLFLSHDIDTFTNLKLIQLTSAGFDRIPIDKINARGIKLLNARGVYSTPLAEWTLFRVLEHYKQGWCFKEEQETGTWKKHRDLREIAGKKVAIVGAGSVGQEVAKRFHAFGSEITGFDIRTITSPFFDYMASTETLTERICDFDIIVITAPLSPSSKGLTSRVTLQNLKKNAILVNIARGGLVDQKAMIEVLSERKDVFAALDVFETEPLEKDNPLWSLENVAISPHNAFVGDGNDARMFSAIYNNLKKFIDRTHE